MQGSEDATASETTNPERQRMSFFTDNSLRRRLGNSSIRFKLVAMMSLSCLVAVILCCGGFVANDMQTLHDAKTRQLQSQAKMLAFNSSAVILFAQQDAGEDLLSACSAEPTVEQAVLYSVEGDIIATYPAINRGYVPSAQSLMTGTWQDQKGRMCHVEPVMDAGENVGSLYVAANLTDVQAQLRHYFTIAALMMALAILVSIVLAWAIQGVISGPIVHLASVANRIREQEDYSVRVNLRREDEIGSLFMAFNAMLTQIESSKNALREANDRLEDRVDERTAQLQLEIEERERTGQQLIKAKEQAEKANTTKSMFLANMSHEIRTPMNAILGFTDLLRRDDAQEDQAIRADYLNTIHASGQHLLSLINDILDLSKIEADRIELHIAPESPHQIISETVSVMRVRAQQKGLSLDYAWDGPVPRQMHTDGARLRQMLLNLIGNAIKFTAIGGVKVGMELVNVHDEPQLQIEVIDTGIGIPEHKLNEIFKPFSQADVSTTREFGGTGLGLTISRRIAEAMGGALSVTSQTGQGSVFKVTVPAGQLNPEDLISTPPTTDIIPSRNIANESDEIPIVDASSILLVEDGKTNRQMINLLLKRHHIKVTDAENGQIGVDLAMNNDFDLILMDMQMPVKDSYTAATELRDRGLHIPIIALTSHAMAGDREKCLQAGCDDYLTKPINEKRLVQKLAQYLNTVEEGPDAATAVQLKTPQPSTSAPIASALSYEDSDYREIIDDFSVELTAKLIEMNVCCDQSDFEGLAHLAHWLKGTAGTAGFDHFTIPAIRLERYARSATASASREALNIIVGLAQLIQRREDITLRNPSTKPDTNRLPLR